MIFHSQADLLLIFHCTWQTHVEVLLLRRNENQYLWDDKRMIQWTLVSPSPRFLASPLFGLSNISSKLGDFLVKTMATPFLSELCELLSRVLRIIYVHFTSRLYSLLRATCCTEYRVLCFFNSFVTHFQSHFTLFLQHVCKSERMLAIPQEVGESYQAFILPTVFCMALG